MQHAADGRRATDIRELRSFVAIARAGSVSGAAERLNIAQPALSRQVQKLEDELGANLLVRHGRGVTLTQAGTLLLERAEALIRDFEQLAQGIRAPEDVFTGHVVLGVPPAAGLLIAPAVFKLFRARWPSATLQIREGISSLLEEWLLDGRLDIAVLHNPPPLAGIDTRAVLQERMVLACPPSAEAGADAPIRFGDIGAVQLILPSMPHSNRRLVERAAVQHGTRLSLLLEVDSVPLTKAMVRGGIGSTILTLAGVATELAAGELVARPIHRPPLFSVVAVAVPQASRAAWISAELFTLVRGVLAELVGSGAWPGARLLDAPDAA
ncbi:LysR family transcriptional regulator [Acidisphaera sp. L21]|uniref:LysR family transcriptional regulator n=1 Tax=Acidisphaera sp. L21 TaxID=1641851 RepID=UPI00131B5CE8|nr:LysR substrate-binding domain-containing protein [Acidisphaera sp. L21]